MQTWICHLTNVYTTWMVQMFLRIARTALFVKADDVFYKGGQLSLASRCFQEKQILMM